MDRERLVLRKTEKPDWDVVYSYIKIKQSKQIFEKPDGRKTINKKRTASLL